MKYILVVLLSLASSCAQLGLPTPQTFNERIAAAYVAVTAARDTATTLLVSKKISADDAQNVQTQADTARTGLDIARKIHATDAAAGNDKLASVQASLVALQSYLAARK